MANQEASVRELTDTVGSMILQHWVKPRENALENLAASPLLHARRAGEVDYSLLVIEWKQLVDLYDHVFFIYYADRSGAIDFYPPGELPPITMPWHGPGTGWAWLIPGSCGG